MSGFRNQLLTRLIVANTIITAKGIFFYSGTPAAGNLIASIANISGTDQFGNAYVAGNASYSLVSLSGVLFAVSLNGGLLTVFTASSAAGPWTQHMTLQPTLLPAFGNVQAWQTIAPLLIYGSVSAPLSEALYPPSGDTSGATDFLYISKMLAATRNVRLTSGTYYINAALTPPVNSSLIGAGAAATVINQVTSAAEGITCTNVGSITLRGFFLAGNGSGVSTAAGIHFASNPPTANIILDDIIVQGFGLQGFLFDSVFLTELRKCEALQNGGQGFQVTNSFAVATSFSFHSCYANQNGGNGYELDGTQYSSLNGCAADGNPTGYALFGCQGVTLTSCGTEAFTATGYLFNNCKGCALYGGFTFNGKTKVAWVTNATARQTIGGLTETSPAAGAAACVQTDAGTSSVLWGITKVTADNLAAGTFTNVDGSA